MFFFFFLFFFFQAEDGIRDTSVTGVQTCALPIFPVPTASIVGPLSATRRKTAPSPRNTFRAIWSAMTILMTTATGAMSRNTATFGIRAKLLLAGPLTAMAIGTGSARGAGRGLIIHHGASR